MPVRPLTFLQRQRAASPRPPAYDVNRGTSAQRGYGHRWRKLRMMILNRDPVCAHCHRAPSTDVDHIIAKAKGGTDEDTNLQGLCAPCHTKKTNATDGGGFRRKPQPSSTNREL